MSYLSSFFMRTRASLQAISVWQRGIKKAGLSNAKEHFSQFKLLDRYAQDLSNKSCAQYSTCIIVVVVSRNY
jgi:hypothetical protein